MPLWVWLALHLLSCLPQAEAPSGAKILLRQPGLETLRVPRSGPAERPAPPARPRVPTPPSLPGSPRGRVETITIPFDAPPVSPPPVSLGLQYWLLRSDDTGREQGVASSGAIFHTGDRFRLRVGAKTGGYLAVVHVNLDGRGGLLYPRNEADLGKAPVAPPSEILLPPEPNRTYRFGGKPGTERLWIVFTRDPESMAALHLKTEMSVAEMEVLRRAARARKGAKDIVDEEVSDPDGISTLLGSHAGDLIVQELGLIHEQ